MSQDQPVVQPAIGLAWGEDKLLDRTPVDYCSVEQVKDHLWRIDLDHHGNFEDIDYEIKRARDLIKGEINNWTKTEFDFCRRVEWTETELDRDMELRFYPILNVEFLRLYTPNFSSYINYPLSGIQIKNRIGIIAIQAPLANFGAFSQLGGAMMKSRMPYGYEHQKYHQMTRPNKNVQVVYTTGFLNSQVPNDFSTAAAKWVAGHLYRVAHMRLSEGLKSKVISGVQENYGAYGEYGDKIILEAKQALSQYRRVEVW